MIDNGLTRGSVYIPPSYRGNALALEFPKTEKECQQQPPPAACTERKVPLLSGLCSGDGGWLWVALIIAAVLLLCREKEDGTHGGIDDTLLYLGVLLLLM